MKSKRVNFLRTLTGRTCACLLTLSASNSFALPTKNVAFAYTKDAPPVSNENKNGILEGFCGSLRSYLINEGWTVEDISITYPERFKVLASKRPDIHINRLPAVECGPTTINEERLTQLKEALGNGNKGFFSVPFFKTSTKLLVNKEKLEKLYEDSESLVIGVQGYTTNNQVIKKIYPSATIKTVENRADAVDRLTTRDDKKHIDAYTGDEVILIDLLKENSLGDRFSIEPKLYGYTHEQYGVVVYNNTELLDSINGFINKDGQKAASRLNNKNLLESLLQATVQSRYFYSIVLLFLLTFFVLLATNPVFLVLLFKLMPFRLKRRLLVVLDDRLKRNTNNPMANLVNSILKKSRATHREFEILLIVRELGLRPLFNEYRSEGLSSDEAIEKLTRTLREIEKNESFPSKILSKWFDETGNQGIESINNKLIDWFRSQHY